MLSRPIRRLIGRPFAVSHFHTSSALWGRKTLQKFKLADIGEGITECEVVKWSIKPSATIQAFDPLCEVQSDKASVEITSPFDGIIKELLVKEGEIAKVGEGLCIIEVEEEEAELDPNAESVSTDVTAASSAPTEPLIQTREEICPPPVEPAQPQEAPRKLHPMDPNYVPPSSSSSKDVFAAPSVRHFARQKGVNLVQVAPGSGKGGRVEKRDIETFLAGKKDDVGSQKEAVKPQADDVVVELGRTRYGMWKAMVKSLEIPHFGYSTTLDLTRLHNMLPTLNAHIPPHYLPPSARPSAASQLVNPSALYPAPSQSLTIPESAQYTKLTFLPILLKTLAKAMHEWPLLRSSITPSSLTDGGKPTLTIRPHADISIALSTPTGLYTPTLTRADQSSIYALTSQLKHLSHLGRQVPSQLTPKEMPKRGGTVTVSNVGAIGAGDFASPVLVPGGGVAIVAIGRAKWVWDVDRDEKGERRLKVGVSWSADHRVIEGAELAAFVECWRGYVEAPERLIAEGV